MLKEKKSLPNSRIKLTATATAAEFRHAFDHELEDISKDVSLPGFRPGKAPKAKVLAHVGRQRVEASAIDHAISHVYYDTIKEAQVVPVENPTINVEKYEAPGEKDADDKEVITFTVEVDVLPEVKLDGYKKIKLKKPAEPKIEEDEVKKVIEYLLKQKASLKVAEKEVALAEGMWADIGYEGSIEGVKRTDMKNEHHPLVIGEGQLIPGFEDAIIGMKVGEKRTISVIFPKDYQASELAGKKAQFDVEIHELKEVVLPAKDAAFAKDFGHSSFEKLEAAIKENLHEEKAQESRQQLEEQVLEQLLKLAHFETPSSLIEQERNRMFGESQERLQQMNFNWETYLSQVKKTAEEVKEEMRPQAEKNVKVGLALGKVIQEEGLKEGENAGREAINRLMEIATADK